MVEQGEMSVDRGETTRIIENDKERLQDCPKRLIEAAVKEILSIGANAWI